MTRLCVGFGWLRLVGYVAGLVVSVNSELHQQHAVANHPTPPVARDTTGLQYSYSYIQDNKLIIHVRGEINKGDAILFPKWVTDNMKNGGKIAGVSLDSPGGSVARHCYWRRASEERKSLPLSVLERNAFQPVSIFAAGQKRFASREGYIGVHSLVMKGEGET